MKPFTGENSIKQRGLPAFQKFEWHHFAFVWKTYISVCYAKQKKPEEDFHFYKKKNKKTKLLPY